MCLDCQTMNKIFKEIFPKYDNTIVLTEIQVQDKNSFNKEQIQKYETAGNRISASRLFELSTALETPVSFFFQGLPGNTSTEIRGGKSTGRVSEQKLDDPLSKNESLQLINLYWRLPDDDKRQMVMKMLRSLNNIN